MINHDEYANYDALGLAELVTTRQVSADELLAAALRRTEAVNPRIHALNHVFPDRARADLAAGLPEGPFHGVPLALKDLYMVYRDEPTGNGSRYWAEASPTFSSELFERYRRAGFSIFAKSATPEMGFSATTEPAISPPTRNPWNTDFSAGGSSGGAAAAVAAGILPLAHASDSGGSIRIPASCCGLFGLKPSRGRMPMGPERGESSGGLGTVHAIGRSVRDSAALLDCSAGPDPGAPYGMAPPERPWSLEVGAPTGRLRIALAMNLPNGVAMHPDCAAAAYDAALLLEDLGHDVEAASPPLDFAALGVASRVVSASLVGGLLKARERQLGRPPADDEIEPATRALADAALRYSGADYVMATQAFHQAGRVLAAFQAQYPLILAPTLAQPPPRIGALAMNCADLDRYLGAVGRFAPMASLANITGVPAASIPLFWNEDGLPVGVHLTARFSDEATLLRVASQIEAARPWRDRRPTL